MSAPVLAIEALSKNFDGLTAVKNVNMTVGAKEICGLIGPNGAGKSTLFNLIAGELAPSAGSISLRGIAISGLPADAVARFGISRAFQLVHLFLSMTAIENVMVGAQARRSLSLFAALTHTGKFRNNESEIRQRAFDALDAVGMKDYAGTRVENLPHGRQRLVATARALAADPALLLLDEPAAGLSAAEIDCLAKAITDARDQGISILLVEHNVGLVLRLCDHVVVLHKGEKIADGSPTEVRASDAVAEAYLGR
jgi:ABC-type branched-subunit amino acid transport system ATPase component